jgi:aminopeptidase Y
MLVGCDSGGERPPQPPPPPPPEITRAELDEHLRALQRIADRNGGTRAAGTPGDRVSVDYVAARLRAAGWRVTLQPLRFPYFELNRARVQVAGRPLRRAREFQVLSYSGSGRASGRLRLLRSGCSADEYARLSPGDVPLVGRGDCFFRRKALAAQRAGAPALVVIDAAPTRRGVPSGTLAVPGIRIPVVVVSAGLLRDGVEVSLDVDARSGRRLTHNVIAETRGGPKRRVVMAGGHLDSVAGGPGINDNGSGVAALIEAAEAIGPRPRGAAVRLAFWAAEELGLLGSRHYVRSLNRAERRRIDAYLNLDMVGSPNPVPELYIDGDGDLGGLLKRTFPGRLGAVAGAVASDHAPLAAAGVRFNGLYSGSTERGPGGRPRDSCYHLSCDTADRVNRRVLLRMARAASAALRRLSAQAK